MKLSIVVCSVVAAIQVPLQYQSLEQQALAELANQEMRLLDFGPDRPHRWMLEDDKDALRRAGIKYMDITSHQDLGNINKELHALEKPAKLPEKMRKQKQVNKLIKDITTGNMAANMQILTSFHNRYFKSKHGAASGEFLFNLVKNVTAVHPNATVVQFKHPWGQHSVIARIQGSKSNDTIVVGAHQDSANLFLPSIMAAPGADDDASGTVTILEVLRILAQHQFVPENTVEFHWYSAEEGGLLGSGSVFAEYEKTGRRVLAMLQQDMTGYIKKMLDNGKTESLGIITDFVDKDLTEFIKEVVSTYCSIPYVNTKCGYACSDHASASKAGYRSAFVIESEFLFSNPLIHTQNDIMENLSFDHMKEHAKLTMGYVVELAATT